jgi:hypothetical protein
MIEDINLGIIEVMEMALRPPFTHTTDEQRKEFEEIYNMMPEEIPLEDVGSSANIAGIGYDTASKTLAVRFKNDSIYHYSGVPDGVYGEMKSAPSMGSFFHARIKNVYEGTRVA